MKAAILASCFLFFCHPVHRAAPPSRVESPPVSRFCKGIDDAFAKSPDHNREKFIAVFPNEKQAQVRSCLGD